MEVRLPDPDSGWKAARSPNQPSWLISELVSFEKLA